MTKYALLLAAFALSACGEESAPPPVAAQTVAAEPEAVPSLPAPDREIFSAAFAAACPSVEAVNNSACKRAGLGSSDVICEYGLGDDEYLRHKATLTPGDGEWTLADPETICAKHGE